MWPRCPWKGPGQLSVPHEGSVLVKFLSECEQPGPGFREQGHPLGAPACLLAARGCTGRRGTPQASHTPAMAPRETRVERASLAVPVGRLAAELLRGLPLYPTGPRASPVAHAAPRSVPRRLRPQLGVRSLWSLVPAPRAPACQRSACSGCQHPQESSIWRGGSDGGVVQGPDFWKSRAPCSRGCRAVCIARTRTEPPPPMTSLSQEAAAAAPCRPAARLGLERRPRPCSGAVPTLPGGEGGAGAGTPGPQR